MCCFPPFLFPIRPSSRLDGKLFFANLTTHRPVPVCSSPLSTMRCAVWLILFKLCLIDVHRRVGRARVWVRQLLCSCLAGDRQHDTTVPDRNHGRRKPEKKEKMCFLGNHPSNAGPLDPSWDDGKGEKEKRRKKSILDGKVLMMKFCWGLCRKRSFNDYSRELICSDSPGRLPAHHFYCGF